MNEQIQVHSSSGNVFADLGLPNPDRLMLKAELVDRIDELISDRQLTETEAAELLGIDRSTFSASRVGTAHELTDAEQKF